MREAMFIKKNKDKWHTYQHTEPKSPDELAERFTTLMDDVAYSKTFYPQSKLTTWLNGLAASVYQDVYQNKKEKYSKIFSFWKYDLPFLFKKYHRTFLFTTLAFIIFIAIGVVASQNNPEFIRTVLGNQYVDMTESNISQGDPFGVYKDENPFTMFVRIGFNNIRVAFITFISGFTLGIVTFKLLWDNGIMLGAFEYLFFSHGLGIKSILVIWVHGTIEISSIIIAGTAGFILAGSILFPGAYTRLQSFKQGAKDAAKILIALVPFFIIAAFLESYITQLMSARFDGKSAFFLPVWVSVLILLSSLLFITWYFIWWPIVLHKSRYKAAKNDAVSRLLLNHA